MSKVTCPNCETELNGLSNFCPNCGSSLQLVSVNKTRITPVRFFILVVASLGLFLFGWIAQSKISGNKPEKMYTALASGKESGVKESSNSGAASMPHDTAEIDYNDPELNKIREHAKAKPLDIDLQKSLSKLLIQKIRSSETPPQALIFETIDNLRNILNLNPNESEALIAMADISFDQQAFGKAIEFYQKYLAVEKDDLNARSRYASALTFVGKHSEALSELSAVLNKDPKNFHAKAYTAIAYAQMGKIVEARKYGNEALELAPSPEAKERFTQFLKQLDSDKLATPSEESKRNNSKDTTKDSPKDSISDGSNSEGPIVKFVKMNQIAGPKYCSFEINKDNDLVLNFEDFPMQGMPPFVKDKFFNSLKEAAKSEATQYGKIIFRDIAKNQELDVLPLK